MDPTGLLIFIYNKGLHRNTHNGTACIGNKFVNISIHFLENLEFFPGFRLIVKVSVIASFPFIISMV